MRGKKEHEKLQIDDWKQNMLDNRLEIKEK